MFGFGKKDKTPEESTDTVETTVATTAEDAVAEDEAEQPQKQSFFARLKQGLSRTRSGFTENLSSLLMGRKQIDDELLEDLEMLLLTADVGVDVTQKVIRDLETRVSRKQLADSEALFSALHDDMAALLAEVEKPLEIPKNQAKPYVILVVGVNGSGKTTTIGKLSKRLQNQGYSVILAAGDTFRAAAVEQLKTWGERNDIPVIAQHDKADSAAVIFDAVSAASARGIDVVIADTAGRLHTQDNLMAELQKVARVTAKQDETAPHEVMLVVDASIGQNALNQAEQFHQAIKLSGITITKLDGTAKGGIVFAIAQKMQLPIRFIGIGEAVDDLREFKADDFVSALLSHDANRD
jgi:fused signal recognition particle receptor